MDRPEDTYGSCRYVRVPQHEPGDLRPFHPGEIPGPVDAWSYLSTQPDRLKAAGGHSTCTSRKKPVEKSSRRPLSSSARWVLKSRQPCECYRCTTCRRG